MGKGARTERSGYVAFISLRTSIRTSSQQKGITSLNREFPATFKDAPESHRQKSSKNGGKRKKGKK